MKKFAKLILLPLAALAITGCEKKEKQDGPGQTENLATISLNKTSAVIVKGHKETLTATVANGTGDVTWASADTAVATVSATGEVTAVAKGNTTITATYSGKSATCTVVVKNVNDVYALSAVNANANLKEFQNNVLNTEGEFRGETSDVLEVGDDNPIQLKPVLKLIDVDTMAEVPQAAWEYDYELEIKKVVGETLEDAGEAGTFDAKECTFDFAEAAIGSKYQLTVIPGGLTDAQKAKAENKQTITVEVFDGYNVYSEKELAYANDLNFLDDDRQSNDGVVDVTQAWKDFRAANGLDPEYVAGSIYLQASMNITKDSLPSAFFWSSADQGVQESWIGKMKDATDIYCHYARGYKFNGNYFHIDTSNVPVCEDNLHYDDNVSHSTLFKTVLRDVREEPEIVNVDFKNCSYFGNAPRGNDTTAAMGLIFFKINNTHYTTYTDENDEVKTNGSVIRGTFSNFNVTAACISFFGEVGANELVIKDCEVSEGYSNGLYLWNNGNVNFVNSKMSHFGGPVLITDGDGMDDGVMNTIKGFHVVADEETIFDNKVTGSEPWFVNTLGGLPASKMTDIKQLNGIVQSVSGGTKTFVSGANEEMNMIIINYGEIPYLQFQKGSGTTIGIDTDSPYRAGVETYLGYGAPSVMSDNGCAGAWTGSWNPYGTPMAMGGDYVDVIHALNAPGFVDDTLYLSIVFGLENM